ncbi:MAG: radical SAM protein [Candidatus Eisenbacteria bacterium]|nr:radical SAM protein [Candidatus Eisenbacteria bacterium]
MAKRFYITARRGCPRRTLDAGRAVLYLEANGWKPAEEPENADLLLVYTCGGFPSSEDRSLRTLERFRLERKPDAELVATGCLLRIHPEALHASGYHEILPEELERLDGIIGARIPWAAIPDANVPRSVRDLEPLTPGDRPPESRRARLGRRIARAARRSAAEPRRPVSLFGGDAFLIRIATGCRGRCSYCAIRIGAGPLRSKPPEKILAEFRKGLDAGRRRFVLIAEDTGCYGFDLGTDLAALLERLLAEPGEYGILVNDLNPAHFLSMFDRLLPLFRDHTDRFETIILPVQSGSDRILEKMRREYRAGDLADRLRELFAAAPGIRVSTHVLVGFPGETMEDLEKTRLFLESIPFHRIGVYCYQERSGVEAFAIDGKVPFEESRARAEILKRMGTNVSGPFEP